MLAAASFIFTVRGRLRTKQEAPTPSLAGAMARTRMKANFTLFFLVVFLVAAWAGWGWPNIAKIMPVYVAAIPGLVLVLIQLYRDATGWEPRRGRAGGGIEMDEVYDVKLDKKIEFRRTVTFFAWFIGGALGIWLWVS